MTLAAGRTMLAAIGASERSLSVEVLQPALVANPNYPGEYTLDWSNPTVTATVAGNLQPASTRALERAARVGKVGVHELFTDPATLTPLGRVRIGSQQYAILDARLHHSHSHAIVEEVSA